MEATKLAEYFEPSKSALHSFTCSKIMAKLILNKLKYLITGLIEMLSLWLCAHVLQFIYADYNSKLSQLFPSHHLRKTNSICNWIAFNLIQLPQSHENIAKKSSTKEKERGEKKAFLKRNSHSIELRNCGSTNLHFMVANNRLLLLFRGYGII